MLMLLYWYRVRLLEWLLSLLYYGLRLRVDTKKGRKEQNRPLINHHHVPGNSSRVVRYYTE
jgi:hypothetical protein